MDTPSLKEELTFERTLADLVKDLVGVGAGEVGARIEHSLQRLVGTFGVERCTLGMVGDDGEISLVRSAGGAAAPPAPPRLAPAWYVSKLRQGRRIQITEALDELPADAEVERAYARACGMRSNLGLPLMASGRLWGFMGCATFSRSRRWTERQTRRLGLVGEMMLGAMLREDADERAGRRRDELARRARLAALGELTAAIAHELSQPLTAIRLNADATRRMLTDGQHPEQLDEALVDIRQDASRAGEVIARLRSRLGGGPPEKRPLDVNDVIRDLEPIASAELHRRGARLVLDLAPGLPAVTADAVQLQQVLLALLENGAEAMRTLASGARVVVLCTAAETSRGVTVTILDAGPPVALASLDGLFTPLHTTKPDGAGMGLAICRSIIEAHGGHIWAETRPAAGLALHFTLP